MMVPFLLRTYLFIAMQTASLYLPEELREPKIYTMNVGIGNQDFLYVTNDYYRPLQYLCEEFEACQFTLQSSSTSTTLELRFVMIPVPILSGPIQLCKIKRRSFKTGFEVAVCEYLSPQLNMAALALESGQEILEVDTYYMTAKNYQEMRRGETTDVYLPEDNEKNYNLTAFVYHHRALLGCTLTTPMEVMLGRRLFFSHNTLNKIMFHGWDSGKNNGLYIVQCYGWDWEKNLTVSLNIHFVPFPAIIFEDILDNTVYFYPNAETATIRTLFISVHDVSSFRFDTSQGLDSGAVVKLARRSEWEVVNVIEINFFFSVTFGKFVLSVTDTSQFTLQKAITIAEKKDIEVFITPVEMDVLEGFSAVFECFAYGVHIEKLKWSRDFEPLHKDKYTYNEKSIEDANQTVLRLVLADLTLSHSGLYTCSASSNLQVTIAETQLNVWPYEDPYIASFFANDLSSKHVIHSSVPVVPYGQTGDDTAILPYEDFFGWVFVLNVLLLLILVVAMVPWFLYKPLVKVWQRKSLKQSKDKDISTEDLSDISSDNESTEM